MRLRPSGSSRVAASSILLRIACAPRPTRHRPIGLVLLLGLAPPIAAQQIVPTDGQVFLASAVLVPGTYTLPNGVSIGASNVTLDLNGATLVGAGGSGAPTYGVTSIGRDHVVIKNGTVRGYYYGVRVENGTDVQVLDNVLSANWTDPEIGRAHV